MLMKRVHIRPPGFQKTKTFYRYLSILLSKKHLVKFTCYLCRHANLQVTLPAKIPAKNDTFNLPRIRYLEKKLQTQKQNYIKYVDFDVKKHSKTLINFLIIFFIVRLE